MEEFREFFEETMAASTYHRHDLDRVVLQIWTQDEGNPRLAEILQHHGFLTTTGAFTTEPILEDLNDELKAFFEQKAGHVTFVGIKFCGECNNMLYPRENKQKRRLEYECRQRCGYVEVAREHCVSIERSTHEMDTLTYINVEVSQDPTLPHTRGNRDVLCPACGYDDAVFFQAQSNREKSKMKLFYVCCAQNCRHKWCEDVPPKGEAAPQED